MCIRDRIYERSPYRNTWDGTSEGKLNWGTDLPESTYYFICLLYTSDAADERSSVDLGGRRIIKKKQKVKGEDVQ